MRCHYEMARMAVVEAAERLGLSERRVRQILADGVLRGERIGRSWVIEQSAIDAIADDRPSVGRPWQPHSAWALLAVAGWPVVAVDLLESDDARSRRAGAELAARRWRGRDGVFRSTMSRTLFEARRPLA
jgi:excisionase family DNA binding protein